MMNGTHVRDRVERRCAELGITLTEVTRRAERTQSWLHSVFQAKRVQPKTLYTLGRALGVETDYFFADSHQEKADKGAA